MRNFSLCRLPFLLLGCMGAAPALANKFQTISGGVSGMSAEKIALLQNLSLYAGGFLLLLALLALLTRKRFEGFVGYSGRGVSNSFGVGVIVLVVLGSVFIVLSLF